MTFINGKQFKSHQFFCATLTLGVCSCQTFKQKLWRKFLRCKIGEIRCFEIYKNNYEEKEVKTKTKISWKKVDSVTYDVLNKHDTISRGLATEEQQQQSVRVRVSFCLMCWTVTDLIISLLLYFIFFILILWFFIHNGLQHLWNIRTF